MTGPMRLDGGVLLDRAQRVKFTFDGRQYEGCAGDTLASALMANDVRLLGRSFKYHRPRGIMAAGSEEPNALVTTNTEGRSTPNVRATMVELFDGLVAQSQNRFPSLRWDVASIADRFSPVLNAGFYYKTFMWPRSFWKTLYEPAIRQTAGLGKAPIDADPDRYSMRYAHCDVLVIGGGPAGLAAAHKAAADGLRVILCDEHAYFGGALLDAPGEIIEGRVALDWRRDVLADLKAFAQTTLLARTTAFAVHPNNFALLCERVGDHIAEPDPRLPRERIWQVRAKRIVLATGAIEQPLVFPHNDRPGVMLASAARAYARRWGAAAGRRGVLVAAYDSGWEDALDLHDLGVEISLIADVRPSVDQTLLNRAANRSIDVILSAQIGRAYGEHAVTAIEVNDRRFDCDLVLVSGGWMPAVHLYAQAGGALNYDDEHGVRLPDGALSAIQCAGACNGAATTAAALAEGRSAVPGGGNIDRSAYKRLSYAAGANAKLAHAAGKAFIDFHNDVTTKDIRLSVQEGFSSVEHLKRYTTTGMGVDQGKTSNLNAISAAAQMMGQSVSSLALTTFRMPYTPVTFGAMAGGLSGALFEPLRKTPIDPWAADKSAVFEPVGNWRRARYFPKDGEGMDQAVARECLAVRNSVGQFDASTLGKIEVTGPDAAAFLERIYVNRWRKLAVGRCRYGLMLREDGMIFDDGVVGRISDTCFHVTTTTGGAHSVLNHMEDYLQTEWPDLKVGLTDITEQWAVIALQGPRSRDVVADLVSDIDISPEAMPHMSVRNGNIQGTPVRLFRVSFTGECGYEINVPANRALAVWELVYDQTRRFEGCAYGTEAMHVLRAEKGYIIIGQDTDGTVTLDDAGYNWMLGKKEKPDFIGKRSLKLSAIAAAGRKQLVGLQTEDPSIVLEEGAQITVASGRSGAAIGHVTSSYASAAAGRSIALALIEAGRDKIGESVFATGNNALVPAQIVSPVFYDREGGRLNG